MSGFVSSMCQFVLSVDGSMSCSSFLTAKTSPWSSYTWKLYLGLPSTQSQPTKSISHTDMIYTQIKQCDRVRAPYDQHTNGSTHTGYFDFTLVKWEEVKKFYFVDVFSFVLRIIIDLETWTWSCIIVFVVVGHLCGQTLTLQLNPHLGEGILYTTCHVNVPFGLWT